MSSYDARRTPERRVRAENEAAKAIRFAKEHGAWPLGMTPAAGSVLATRPDSNDLQRRWGDLAEALLDQESV